MKFALFLIAIAIFYVGSQVSKLAKSILLFKAADRDELRKGFAESYKEEK